MRKKTKIYIFLFISLICWLNIDKYILSILIRHVNNSNKYLKYQKFNKLIVIIQDIWHLK